MRILLAEDNIQLRELFLEKFKEYFAGMIDVASSGNEAISLLNSNRFYDVIVSDYDMENGSGADLLSFKIRNDLMMPFIFFTSTLRPIIPYPANEYLIIEKSQFHLLLLELEKIAESLKQPMIFQKRIKEINSASSN